MCAHITDVFPLCTWFRSGLRSHPLDMPGGQLVLPEERQRRRDMEHHNASADEGGRTDSGE